MAPFTAAIVREALISGAQAEYVRTLRTEYAARSAALCRALSAHAERTGWTFQCPSGGYFLWLRLPDGLTGKEVAAAGEAAGVKARRSGTESSPGRPGPFWLRSTCDEIESVNTTLSLFATQVLDGARCTITENRRIQAAPPPPDEDTIGGWYGDVRRHVRCCFAYLNEEEIANGAAAVVISAGAC